MISRGYKITSHTLHTAGEHGIWPAHDMIVLQTSHTTLHERDVPACRGVSYLTAVFTENLTGVHTAHHVAVHCLLCSCSMRTYVYVQSSTLAIAAREHSQAHNHATTARRAGSLLKMKTAQQHTDAST